MISLVVDNGTYGTIRMHQEREFPGRVSGSDLFNPDFAALARAYGWNASRVEATAQFPARVKRVEFRSGTTTLSDLQDGDCELMEQLVRSDVFGKLGARVVDARTHCVPRQVTLGAVRMAVEVLEPVPAQ